MAIVEYNLPLPDYYGKLRGESGSQDFICAETCEHERIIESEFKKSIQTLENALWEERNRKTSTPEQLADPIRRGLIGVVIPSLEEDPNSVDANLISGLSNTLLSLTDPETAALFVEWVSEKQKGSQKEQNEYLLQSLLHFSTLLDTNSYLQFTNSDLRPLETLSIAACAGDRQNPRFQQARTLFLAQYNNLLYSRYIYPNTEIESIFNSQKPDARQLGEVLLPWVDQQVGNGEITLETGLRATLNYLEMYEAQNKDRFLKFIEERYGLDNVYVQNIKKRAINHNLVRATPQEIEYVIDCGLKDIINNEKIDAADINYKDKIPNDTEEVLIAYATGAYGPPHIGHFYTDEVVEALMEEMMHANPKLYCQLVLAPTVSPEILEKKTSKSAAQIGSIIRRTECLFGLTRYLKHTHITTRWQQEFKDDPMKRIHTIQSRAIASMKDSWGGDQLPYNVKFVRVLGIDKLIHKNPQTGDYTLANLQEEYLVPSIVKVRRKYLSEALKHLLELRQRNPKTTIILTPDTSKGSSSEGVWSQDKTYFPLVELAIGNGDWDLEKINERTKKVGREQEVPSATEIYRNLQKRIREGQLIAIE